MIVEDIRALRAGPEMDAMVAIEVMGDYHGVLGEAYGVVYRWKHDGIIRPDPWPYSTEIESAWEVVKKLWDVGLHVQFSLKHQITAGGWRAEFPTRVRKTTNYVEALGATAPEAICRAALLSVLPDSVLPY